MQGVPARAILLSLIAPLLACGTVGCSAIGVGPRTANSSAPTLVDDSLGAAETQLARGVALESSGDEGCVEAYFLACSLAWHSLHEEPTAGRCYTEAVARLLGAAQAMGRLDPARGLIVREDGRSIVVPAHHHGFAWQASDFQRLHLSPTSHESRLSRSYVGAGIGLPLVVERGRNDSDRIEAQFLPEKSFFAATAVMRFCSHGEAPGSTGAVLEFYNPLSIRSIPISASQWPLASDLSAPLAKVMEQAPRSYFAGFIEPGGAGTTARLNFLEPYQPKKVPVVLIHGLFSDPQSWADLINDLRAAPGFADRYQLWVFRYPTGQGFLQSAAVLRNELRTAVEELDPNLSDPALQQIVLVGHSMGGLIAKLQVTHSEEFIWPRLANRPLEEIVTTEATRARLAETCYFDPSPHVARVIFIASPHQGSLCTSSLVGRGAALLVEPSPEQAAMHEQLVRDNPHVFNPDFEQRFPTSIDMLVPSSPLLAAMQQLRFGSRVRLHNIIGVSHPVSLDGPSDGVVSVRSASHPGCQSVLAIGAPHSRVHRTLKASAEVIRILQCQ
jgi:pimeloyl-ACP methyl ester carboxylesterase